VRPKLITLEGENELGVWPAVIAKIGKVLGTVVGGIAGAAKRKKAERLAREEQVKQQQMVAQQMNYSRSVSNKKNMNMVLIGTGILAVYLLTSKDQSEKTN